MADVIRFIGLLFAAVAFVGCCVLMALPKDWVGFRAPWRHWGAAAGILIELSGIYARIDLWGTSLSYRDIVFLAINACIIVCVVGLLRDAARQSEPVEL